MEVEFLAEGQDYSLMLTETGHSKGVKAVMWVGWVDCHLEQGFGNKVGGHMPYSMASTGPT